MDDNTTTTEETFDQFIGNERDAFVKSINEQEWNTQMRTSAESLLIAYDQMRERLNTSNSTGVKSKNEIKEKIVELQSDVQRIKEKRSKVKEVQGSTEYDDLIYETYREINMLKWVLRDK